jgi:hypothetical protein
MDLILGTVIEERDGPVAPNGKFRRRAAAINLIVMSRETAREIMRNDYGRLFNKSLHRDQPDRLGPALVAYDDSLGLGEFLIAEAIGGH